jgi:probable HAF family extracellular repeat protein
MKTHRGVSAFLAVLLGIFFCCSPVLAVQYQFIDLRVLPGGNHSEAASINNNGQIVGYANNSSEYHATLFDSTGAGNNIDLGILPGGNWSCAKSINNNGQIVGYARSPGIDCTHAVLFDPTGAGNNIDLDPGLLNMGTTRAESINDNGQIVGIIWDSSHLQATLFDSTGGGDNISLEKLPPGSLALLFPSTIKVRSSAIKVTMPLFLIPPVRATTRT